MQNEILNQQIIRELRKGPLNKTELAERLLPEDPFKVSRMTKACNYLDGIGKIRKGLFGERYELASGGYCPGPEGGSAA